MVYYTGESTKIAKRSIEQTEIILSQSARSIDSSSKYNRRTVEIADSVMKIENRAYIGLKGITLTKPLEIDKPFEGKIVIVNYGKTPAYHLWNHYYFWINDTLFSMPNFDNTATVDSTWTIGPTMDWAINFESRAETPNEIVTYILDSTMFKNLQSGKFRLYVYFEFRYSDVFGIDHRTGICSEYKMKTGEFISSKRYNFAY